MTVVVNGTGLTLEQVEAVARQRVPVEVAPEAWERIRRCRAMCEEKVANREVMYGVTTGIGEFSEVVLTPEQTQAYQKYLIYSHAAGIGDPAAMDVTRAAILSRINVLCHGRSGIRPEVVEALVALLNKGVTPVMCEKGSVGACGDLSPMAQMALVLIGEGEAFYEGERLAGAEALSRAGLSPIRFEARDGLATINGSHVIAGSGALLLREMERWIKHHDIVAAMTLEALNANMLAYDDRIHRARGFTGAVTTAANIRRLTEGSALLERPGKKVQDAYSLRSTPQVVGAARDALAYARGAFLTELNGVCDNPIFFPDEGDVVTGANFQGTPTAFALEFAAMGITTVSALSERRTNRLLNPALSQGLPGFLTKGGGMFSGLMVAQYTAGALVCESRVLSTPAAIGSIPAAADQEDFVSMGMTTAHKTRQIVDNAYGVLAIELMAAAQAFEFRRPARPAKPTAAAYDVVRQRVPALEADRALYDDINALTALVREGELLAAVESVVGELAV